MMIKLGLIVMTNGFLQILLKKMKIIVKLKNMKKKLYKNQLQKNKLKFNKKSLLQTQAHLNNQFLKQ